MAKNKTSKKTSPNKKKKKKVSKSKQSEPKRDESISDSNIRGETKTEVKDDTAGESKPKKVWNPNIGWALTLIFVGIFALLVNFKLLSWWALLMFFFRFWPVWLILVGIRLILGRSTVARIVTILISLLTFVVLIIFVLVTQNQSVNSWYNDHFTGFNIPHETENRAFDLKSKEIVIGEEEFEGISKRNVELKIGASQFEVADNRQNSFMNFSGTYYDAWGEPGIETEQNGNDLDLIFTSNSNNQFSFPFFMPKPGSAPKYLFEIGQEYLSTDLIVNLGAGDGKITLDELNLEKLSTDVGAGKLQIELEDYAVPGEEASFNVGAGEIILQIPKDVGLKVDYTIGAGEFEVKVEDGDGFKSSGIGKDGVYESENYDNAVRKLNVKVNVGAGEMKIDRVE